MLPYIDKLVMFINIPFSSGHSFVFVTVNVRKIQLVTLPGVQIGPRIGLKIV